jgi:hypothetical protein
MTTATPPARSRARWLLPLLALVFLGAIGVGAYYDWYMWHPMSAVVVTLIAGVLVLAGGLASAVRSPRVRPIGFVLVVAGLGAIVGSLVNPTRPPVVPHQGGSLRLVLAAPAAFDAAGDADCGSSEDASQVVVSPGEFGLARTSEEADFHYVYITIGDMYDFGDPAMRSDHLSLTIEVQAALIPADFDGNGKPGATRHSSDPSSVLALSGHSRAGGTITFSNLSIGEPPDPSRRSDLSGTITWTCGPVGPGSGPEMMPGSEEEPVEEPPASASE